MFYRSLYSRIFLRKFRFLSVYFYQDLYQSIYSFPIYQLNFLTIYQFYLSINLEDITLNSLHTTLVFQGEDEVVACPPKTPQSYPKRAEDKRQLCPPLETPVSYSLSMKCLSSNYRIIYLYTETIYRLISFQRLICSYSSYCIF